jgi:quercetin dioxygenase-like cupin family protein
MEIRRFGVGHRRPDGPARTSGVASGVIHADARGAITEIVFARGGRMEPHTNPNEAWLVVIEGGGWVRVGGDVARVAAGEAVRWPAGVDHAAWAEASEMRAIVVELAGPGAGEVHSIDAAATHRRVGGEDAIEAGAQGEPR